MALFLYLEVKQKSNGKEIKANGKKKQTNCLLGRLCVYMAEFVFVRRGLSRPRRCRGTDTPWTLRCGCGGWLRPGSCSRPPFWFWDTAVSAGHGAQCWSPPPAGFKATFASLCSGPAALLRLCIVLIPALGWNTKSVFKIHDLAITQMTWENLKHPSRLQHS